MDNKYWLMILFRTGRKAYINNEQEKYAITIKKCVEKRRW